MKNNEQKLGITNRSTVSAPSSPPFMFGESTVIKEWRSKIVTWVAGLAYSLTGFGILIGIWAIVATFTTDFPGPQTTLKVLYQMLLDPFYVYGPNDMGIGLQLWS